MVAQLAEQTEALKAAQGEAKAKETDLLAEFETERAAWAQGGVDDGLLQQHRGLGRW